MGYQLFQSSAYLDFHTHAMRKADEGDVVEIVSLHLGQEKAHDYFTVGLHPWWTTEPVTMGQRQELISLLHQENCLAMGEMGLDNLKGPALHVQMDAFRSQLSIANDLGKPVIIHCVRAFDQLMQVKREFPSIKKWCVHGYGRHAILARQLIDQGFYLSIMPTLSMKYRALFQALPHDRLFLETDSMADVDIVDLYSQVAGILDMNIHHLTRQMNSNARDFFQR